LVRAGSAVSNRRLKMADVSLLAAFVAGLISFISPCVLPLVPAYLSFISGVSIEDMKGEGERVKVLGRVSINSIFFILGFSVVFVALGASASFIGRFLLAQLALLSKIAGVIIIIFGLHMAGVFRIRALYSERRFQGQTSARGPIGAFLIGLAFAFGWTPCIGPILAGILAIASTKETVGQGVVLLGAYSLGLGLPFFLAGLGINTFLSLFDRIKRRFRFIEVVSGLFLVIVGVLIFFNFFAVFSQYLMRWLPWLGNLG
jgi:cytochrome c-type biogenesis protein